jgi:hypothetical protein
MATLEETLDLTTVRIQGTRREHVAFASCGLTGFAPFKPSAAMR